MTMSFGLALVLPAHKPQRSHEVRAPFSLAAGQPISLALLGAAARLARNVRQPQALASKWSDSVSHDAMHKSAKA